MCAPREEHLVPENTWVPFLSLDSYVAFHLVRQDQYLYKIYQTNECNTCVHVRHVSDWAYFKQA